MAVGSKDLDCVTFTVASSLSAASQQFSFVKLTSAGAVVPVNGNTDLAIGVVRDSPAVGEMALIAYSGIVKCRVGGTSVALGDRVGADSTGRAIALTAGTSTGFFVLGRVVYIDSTDNAGALVSVLLDCAAPPRNA